MRVTLKEIQLLLVRLSIALLAYPVSKILFFIFNYPYFTDVSFTDLIAILFFGLRFDLSAMVLMNLPFVLLHIIPFGFTRKKWYRATLKTVFLTLNGIAILADCIDLEYYKYTFKRTTADVFDLFGLGSDISNMLPQYARDFWYILLIAIALIFLLSWLYNKTNRLLEKLPTDKFSIARAASWLVLNVLLLGLMIIAFRGGLQLRPIMPINASAYVSAKNIPLVINTPFSIIKSFGLEELEEEKYFSEGELKNIYDPVHSLSGIGSQGSGGNVFIIILESFSKEFTSLGKRKSYTPFLDSLMNESLVFDRAFANGKKSIEGIPAILSGIPALMNESFITSTYCSNQFNSLPNTLRSKGYSSAFFHGGIDGTMGFDGFCGSAGFDNYYGKAAYDNDADYDGEWGIWDEPFFQYAEKSTDKIAKPFFVTLFSLSSHHPYSVPEQLKDKFKGGEHPILKSVEYADYSLRKFFESASKAKWFDSTLFVITADHTGPSEDPYYSNSAGSFEVPVIYYKRNSLLKGVDHRITQHIDIMPTVLNYLNYDKPVFYFGNNAFDTTASGFAVNYSNNIYQLFQDDHLLQFDGTRTIALFDLVSDSLLQNNRIGKEAERQKKMETKLKAIIQTYRHSMIHNRLTAKTE